MATSRMMKQQASKICAVCGREMRWRKRWERNWDHVRYCSRACRSNRLRKIDGRLEAALLDLLRAGKRGASLDLEEAARAVWPHEEPERRRALLESLRRAARRLAAGGVLEIIRHGRVVDASRAAGAIRVRLVYPSRDET